MKKEAKASGASSSRTKPKKFGGYLSESESEDEIDTPVTRQDEEIEIVVQENVDKAIKDFKSFLNNPDFITANGDPKTNIVDRYNVKGSTFGAKTFCVPDDKIRYFFKHLEYCRRRSTKLSLYEKQSEYSGIMLDFDIYQTDDSSHLNDDVFREIVISYLHILIEFIDLARPVDSSTRDDGFSAPDIEEEKTEIYFGFIKKPKVTYIEEKKCYKDGFHVIIPSLKLNRETKRFLLTQCQEQQVFKNALKHISFVEGQDFLTCLDMNCAHVPCYFVGCSSKPKAPPYILHDKVYKVTIDALRKIPSIEAIRDFSHNVHETDINVCHEFSINWEKRIIKKKRYHVFPQYVSQLQPTQKIEELEHMSNDVGELSLLKLHDPDTEYIMRLLDTLNPRRASDFGEWFNVLCALAHTSKSYKPLAEYFSKKCPEKFNPIDFENHWNMALQEKQNNLRIGSLHYWAKLDNPDKYDEVHATSICELVYKKVYDKQIEGDLQHYDIAQILFSSLKNKYVYDPADGGSWFEFVTDKEPHKAGEIFKWRREENRHGQPASIKRYMSEILSILFNKILNRIDNALENAKSEEIMKYHNMIKKNIKKSCKGIRSAPYKKYTVTECEQIFEKFGFVQSLNKVEDVMGVGNGILKLGKEVYLIDGYHEYPISLYSEVKYKPFNPYDPTTKKVLIALREIFPDDEPDTFEFIMTFFASSLDGKRKESIFLLLVGNGSNAKTFLMEMLNNVLGPKYAVKMPLAFLTSRQRDSESATPSLVNLMDARLARYSESSQCELLHTAKMKELTGQETMAGRALFKGQVNFKPVCNHIVTSNYSFEVDAQDEASWRRILLTTMRMKFIPEGGNIEFDPKNPFHRRADISKGKSWPEDPEILSAFLGILTYFYENLQTKYDGSVLKVPHPTIKTETEIFRNKQDKINNFINSRIVKSDSESVIKMAELIDKYTRWHDSLYPDDKGNKKNIRYDFENSKLSKIISKDHQEFHINGYRILENGEELGEGEEYFSKEKELKIENKHSESPEKFYNRICREYDEKMMERRRRQAVQTIRKVDYDSDDSMD